MVIVKVSWPIAENKLIDLWCFNSLSIVCRAGLFVYLFIFEPQKYCTKKIILRSGTCFHIFFQPRKDFITMLGSSNNKIWDFWERCMTFESVKMFLSWMAYSWIWARFNSECADFYLRRERREERRREGREEEGREERIDFWDFGSSNLGRKNTHHLVRGCVVRVTLAVTRAWVWVNEFKCFKGNDPGDSDAF